MVPPQCVALAPARHFTRKRDRGGGGAGVSALAFSSHPAPRTATPRFLSSPLRISVLGFDLASPNLFAPSRFHPHSLVSFSVRTPLPRPFFPLFPPRLPSRRSSRFMICL